MIALMEFLPKDEIIDFIIDSECVECDTDKKRNLESIDTNLIDQEKLIKSDNLIRNLGIMFVIALGLSLFLLLLLLMRCLKRNFNRL